MAPCSDGYVHSQLIPAGTSGNPSAMVLLICAILQNIAACAANFSTPNQPTEPPNHHLKSINPKPTTSQANLLQPSKPQVDLNLLHPIAEASASAAASSPPTFAWRATAAGAGPETPQGSWEAASSS